MPSQHVIVQTGSAEDEVDGVLREEREGSLTTSASSQQQKQEQQYTFSFLKPEAVKQRLVGEVVSRFERKGFTIRELRLHRMTKSEAERLYSVHKGKAFYEELVTHVTSGPVVLMIVAGPNPVETVRKLIGATNPLVAEPGTIRGDFSTSITANIIHASDSPENVKKEASIFFPVDMLR
jgi:nucleoside-diphosphate kinase